MTNYIDDDFDEYDEEPDYQTIICPECGKELYEDTDICPNCGMFIIQTEPKQNLFLYQLSPIWYMLAMSGIVATIIALVL
jgi:predicted amidophosphoribosyltransferase